MSASDSDERNNRLDISRYAPPQYRTREGATIRPVLERLSRGLSDGDADSTAAQPVPPAEPIHIHDAPSSPRFPLSMTARLAAAMSLAAVLAAVSVTFLQSKAEHPAPTAAADTPKPIETTGIANEPKTVNTVTFRRETATEGEVQASADVQQEAPSQSGASFAERVEAVEARPAPPRVETSLALTAPLKMWAMFPSDPSADDQGTEFASANAGDGKDAKDAASKQAAVRHQRAKAANQARRRRTTRRRRTRTAATKPQQQQPVETAQTEAKSDQPTEKNLLRAAIDAIFGNGDGNSDSAAASTPPATTGAAFQ